MKRADIFKGQTFTTEVLSRFDIDNKPLSPITILAHVEGFVIFKRDNHKMAVETKSFISTYLTACKYRLKKKAIYQLSNDLPLRLIKAK